MAYQNLFVQSIRYRDRWERSLIAYQKEALLTLCVMANKGRDSCMHEDDTYEFKVIFTPWMW